MRDLLLRVGGGSLELHMDTYQPTCERQFMLHTPFTSLNRRERRKRKVALKLGAAFAATMILAGGISTSGVFTPTAAHAVTEGAGYGSGASFVGAFMHSDGSITYCAELGQIIVLGNNPTLNDVTSLPSYTSAWVNQEGVTYTNVTAPALTGTGLKTLNYVLSHWGNTSLDLSWW